MNRPLRIVVATAALAVAGAVLGALAGMAALVVGVAITKHQISTSFIGFPAVFGAALGAVAAPAAGWLLLRRVPLGLAAGGAVLGTVVGGAVGWALSSITRFDSISAGLLGALLGFVAAALALRLTVGRTPASSRRDVEV